MHLPKNIDDADKLWLLGLGIILIFGFFLRIETISVSRVDHPIRADAADYTAYAYNLNRHGVYSRNPDSAFGTANDPAPDAVRSPGYPFLISFLTSEKIKAFIARVTYSQALISVMTLILIALLAYQLLGKWGALFSVLFTALSPHLILANIYILTESIYTFILLLTSVTLVKATQSDNRYYWLIGAILLAITTLIRPTTQYYILILALWIWMVTDRQTRKKTVLLFVAAFLVVITIWTVRNLLAIERTSDPTLMISGLHHGMYPGFMYDNKPESFGFPYRFDPNSTHISTSVSNVLLEIYSRFMNSPVEHILWYVSKPAYFFQWELIQGSGIHTYPMLESPYNKDSGIIHLTGTWMQWLHTPLVILSILGTFIAFLPSRASKLTKQQRLSFGLLASLYLYFIVIHIIVAPFPRYSIPLRPITYLLSWLPIYSLMLHLRALPPNK